MRDKLLVCNGCKVCGVRGCKHTRTHIPEHLWRENGRNHNYGYDRPCWDDQDGCWQWIEAVDKHCLFHCVEYTPEVYANLPNLDWGAHDWFQSGITMQTEEEMYEDEMPEEAPDPMYEEDHDRAWVQAPNPLPAMRFVVRGGRIELVPNDDAPEPADPGEVEIARRERYHLDDLEAAVMDGRLGDGDDQ